MNMKKIAFTLAETLIVIGIIGVVAALTLPNQNHATGDKEKVTKVKKIYSALTDAIDRAQVIYGDFGTWCKDEEINISDDNIENAGNCEKRIAKRVTEFMKLSKDCGFEEGCFSSSASYYLDGSIDFNNDIEGLVGSYNKTYMVTLSDGISLGFGKGKIQVDIDGPNKGKNQDGFDRFSFFLDQDTDRLYPDVPYCDTGCLFDASGDLKSNNYILYTLWVIENGNLDYLKCPEDLNWDTQTSCK